MEHDPDQFDARPDIEGPDNGLIEALAERLWKFRRDVGTAKAARTKQWDALSEPVKSQWRETARVVMRFLLSIGFVGPAGPPKDRFGGLTYGWVYEGSDWAIHDEEGGFVALVSHTADLELILAAPAMRKAILDLLASIPDGHPTFDQPAMRALAESVPDY